MKNQEINTDFLSQEQTLLSAERTFSSWLRTGLSAMAGGLAIMRLIHFKTELHKIIAHVIGETLIVWGCMVIAFAALDYKRIHRTLTHTKNYKGTQMKFLLLVVPLILIAGLLIWVTLP